MQKNGYQKNLLGGYKAECIIPTYAVYNSFDDIDFSDMDWNKLPFEQGHPNSNYFIKKPACWDEMVNERDKYFGDMLELTKKHNRE